MCFNRFWNVRIGVKSSENKIEVGPRSATRSRAREKREIPAWRVERHQTHRVRARSVVVATDDAVIIIA